jgi:hypothetical protein
MTRDKPPYPLVYIEWDDSYGVGTNWEQIPKNFPKPKRHTCRSVGWLVYDGKKHKVVVPHLSHPARKHWSGCGDMAIPASAVLKLKRLKY